MLPIHRVTLRVQLQLKEDVYRDRARMAEHFRGPIREGPICNVAAEGKAVLLEIPGMRCKSQDVVKMCELTRKSLGLEENRYSEFHIREARWIGRFR